MRPHFSLFPVAWRAAPAVRLRPSARRQQPCASETRADAYTPGMEKRPARAATSSCACSTASRPAAERGQHLDPAAPRQGR